jgi:hypothetical protein
VTRRVREFIEIRDFASLDDLIDRLTAIRASLPKDAEAELRMKGDDIFGRKLSISYMRGQTAEEAACDARCADALHARRRRRAA